MLNSKKFIALAATIGTAFGNLAIYCKHNERSEFSKYGTFKDYQQCGDVCTCYAFEL